MIRRDLVFSEIQSLNSRTTAIIMQSRWWIQLLPNHSLELFFEIVCLINVAVEQCQAAWLFGRVASDWRFHQSSFESIGIYSISLDLIARIRIDLNLTRRIPEGVDHWTVGRQEVDTQRYNLNSQISLQQFDQRPDKRLSGFGNPRIRQLHRVHSNVRWPKQCCFVFQIASKAWKQLFMNKRKLLCTPKRFCAIQLNDLGDYSNVFEHPISDVLNIQF